MTTKVTAIIPALCMLSISSGAWAGRPLATEDAGVNDKGTCQLEAWVDRGTDLHHTHVAPACGLIDGLELGLEVDAPSHTSLDAHDILAALKWAPEHLTWHGWRFGAKAAIAGEKAAGDSDRHYANWTALGIATYEFNDQWTAHVNLGHTYDKLTKSDSAIYGVAATYGVSERLMVFAELNGDNRSAATQSVGMRWWLLPETLGLDVTTSRTNATSDSQTWGIGLGWYGLKF